MYASLARSTSRVLAALGLSLLPAVAAAQVISMPSSRTSEPSWWMQGGVGLLSPGPVEDGRTASTWDFSQGAQYRASIEYDLSKLGRGLAVGLVGTYAPNVSLGFVDATSRRDAHAVISSALGMFRVGGGSGFHQVIEIQAGFVEYSHFTADNGDSLPSISDTDVILGLGYGFGMTLSKRWQVTLVQDAMQALHQREGLSNGARTNSAHYVTRLSLRYGVALRRPGL